MAVKVERLIEKLDEAHQLFSNNPDLWVKGKLSEDEKGNDVSPRSKKAAKFCAVAMMQKVLNCNEENPTYKEAVTQLNITVGKLYGTKFSAVESMNDGKTGFKQVLRVYRETIKRLQKQGLADAKVEAKVEKAEMAAEPKPESTDSGS